VSFDIRSSQTKKKKKKKRKKCVLYVSIFWKKPSLDCVLCLFSDLQLPLRQPDVRPTNDECYHIISLVVVSIFVFVRFMLSSFVTIHRSRAASEYRRLYERNRCVSNDFGFFLSFSSPTQRNFSLFLCVLAFPSIVSSRGYGKLTVVIACLICSSVDFSYLLLVGRASE
jgi:hypothetical protein